MLLIFPRSTILTATLVAAFLALGACSSGQGSPAPSPTPTPTPRPTASPSPTATPIPTPSVVPTPTAEPIPTPAPEIRGFQLPIAAACLPSSPNLLPNAPRDYRAGLHEGIDFYDGYACAPISKDSPVLAAKAGQVIRADLAFVEMTPEERDRLLTLSQEQGYTDPATLDRFRGRQVWVDHGGGVITRYAHLSAIAPGIQEGVTVTVGQVIGYVGNSGTPEGVTDPDAEVHLHFEIRIGETYLGQGLLYDDLIAVLQQAFSP